MAPVPPNSASIGTREEAQAYYRAKLARAHRIESGGRPVTIVFERDATHLFSVEAVPGGDVAEAERVVRRLPGNRVEVRRFDLERARNMDLVLPAVSNFTVSVPGTGHRGAQNRMLHGRATLTGDYMRVVLRPGPGEAWTCVSAYLVTRAVWLDMMRSKRADFPPR